MSVYYFIVDTLALTNVKLKSYQTPLFVAIILVGNNTGELRPLQQGIETTIVGVAEASP